MINEKKYVKAQNSVTVDIQYCYDHWLIIVFFVNISSKKTTDIKSNKKDKVLNNRWITKIECFEIKRVEKV